MSDYIPVFFFAVKESQVPAKLDTWLDAELVLSERWEQRQRFGLRESLSRNWWHQNALDSICKGLSIKGLEFVRSEIACLCDQELAAAAGALDTLMDELADGVPDLGPFEHIDVVCLRHPRHSDALNQSRPTYKMNIYTDIGFEAAVGFYSFVKSLRAAIDEAKAQNGCLLYVHPQP